MIVCPLLCVARAHLCVCVCVCVCVQAWQEEVLVYQSEVEGLSSLAQQVLAESHISSRVSATATQLTSRYHAQNLLLCPAISPLIYRPRYHSVGIPPSLAHSPLLSSPYFSLSFSLIFLKIGRAS